MNDTDRCMLALAAMTYRGIGDHSEAAIEAKLVPWFDKLTAEDLGRWQLAWGPAAFRAPVSLVDDAMAYVARREDAGAADMQVGGGDSRHQPGLGLRLVLRRLYGELLQELIFQHLDAYLEEAEFRDPPWNTRALVLG